MSEPMRFKDEAQRAFAVAIRQIELYLEPKCEECGVGVSRPNCARDMGGYCVRHQQENTLAFERVIRNLEKTAGLTLIPGWRYKTPIQDTMALNEEETALLQDFYDQYLTGVAHEVRVIDKRLSSLCAKQVLNLSAQYGKFKYQFSSRGLAWAEKLFAKESST